MEERQQQQIRRCILDGIERLAGRRQRKARHKLSITGWRGASGVDRHSLEYLMHFLDNGDSHEVVITELELGSVRLSEPSDGGVQVLRDFFARSDTTLTKVTLHYCDFGSQEHASHVLAAFQTNRTVTDLTIHSTRNLEDAALGACLSGLMQNMPQLQRLDCTYSNLRLEGVRAFQPALQANRTLQELNLCCCNVGDEGVGLLADALFGNTTIDELCIGYNDITSVGLDDITRLLESMQLKTVEIGGNRGVFDNEASTQRFARVLLRHEFLKDLHLQQCELRDGGIRIIVDGLVGNAIMKVLNIRQNHITSNGLANITQLLESTRLQTISLWGNRYVFNDEDATQHFVSTLQHKNSSVQELAEINEFDFPEGSRAATHASIKNSLTRNQQLNRVNLLLSPPPQQQQQQRNTSTMLLKTWHKAITKFAMVPNNAGASAVFKLFTARPQLLEKRLKRPSAIGSRPQDSSSHHDAGNDNSNRHGAANTSSGGTAISGPKRRRL